MKKRFFSLLICTLTLTSLTACATENVGTPAAGEISIYRLIREEYRQGSELIRAEKLSYSDETNLIKGAAAALKSIPENSTLESPLPPGVTITNAERTGRTVYVYMNAAYSELTGIDKTITDSCITLTMCSIPEVDHVTIYTAGRVSQTRLSSEDMVLRNTQISATQAEIRLYFPMLDGSMLAAEYRPVTVSSDVSSERIVIDELLKGPRSEHLRPALPENTERPTVYTQDNICTVSFSGDFLRAFEDNEGEIRLAIYSIVNSLTSLKEIDGVMIVIQNSDISQIGGIDITEPLTRRTSMIGSAVID